MINQNIHFVEKHDLQQHHLSYPGHVNLYYFLEKRKVHSFELEHNILHHISLKAKCTFLNYYKD